MGGNVDAAVNELKHAYKECAVALDKFLRKGDGWLELWEYRRKLEGELSRRHLYKQRGQDIDNEITCRGYECEDKATIDLYEEWMACNVTFEQICDTTRGLYKRLQEKRACCIFARATVDRYMREGGNRIVEKDVEECVKGIDENAMVSMERKLEWLERESTVSREMSKYMTEMFEHDVLESYRKKYNGK